MVLLSADGKQSRLLFVIQKCRVYSLQKMAIATEWEEKLHFKL